MKGLDNIKVSSKVSMKFNFNILLDITCNRCFDAGSKEGGVGPSVEKVGVGLEGLAAAAGRHSLPRSACHF